ncbi:MAG: hydrolase [Anaerocolumna sp.]|nr:hydrolase [Anaerocolumna sp.]
MNNQNNIKRFESLLEKVNRNGVSELINYIRTDTDFYSAPASTQFHLACEGGLLQHSLNIYYCLAFKKLSLMWNKVLENIEDESIILVALLHDLCKVNFYAKGTRNQKTYDEDKVAAAPKRDVKHDDMGDFIWECVLKYGIDDKMPLGHGIMAIRWHMGFSEDKSLYPSLGKAMEEYPLVLALHEADLEASKLIEAPFGNKAEANNILPEIVERPAHNNDDNEPNPFDEP